MMIPADWRYWVDAGELRMGPPAQVPAGARSWEVAAALASADAVRAFVADAVAAGLASAVGDRVLLERHAAVAVQS